MNDLPTVAESGYPGFEALAWNGLFAPAGTPATSVDAHQRRRQRGDEGARRARALASRASSSAAARRPSSRPSSTARAGSGARSSRRSASRSTERGAAPIPAPRLPSPAACACTRFPTSRCQILEFARHTAGLQPLRPGRVVFARAIAIVITLPRCVIKTAARRDHAFIQRQPMTVDAMPCRTPYRPNRCRRRSTPAPISRRRGAASCITGCTSAAGVIHYAGFDRRLRRHPVEEVSVSEFARGNGVALQPHVAVRFDAATAIARARSRLGEDRYRLWSNNCEHFIEWCLNGVNRSAQVERIASACWSRSPGCDHSRCCAARCWRCAPHVRAPRLRVARVEPERVADVQPLGIHVPAKGVLLVIDRHEAITEDARRPSR